MGQWRPNLRAAKALDGSTASWRSPKWLLQLQELPLSFPPIRSWPPTLRGGNGTPDFTEIPGVPAGATAGATPTLRNPAGQSDPQPPLRLPSNSDLHHLQGCGREQGQRGTGDSNSGERSR